MYELSVMQLERALIDTQPGAAPARSGNAGASLWQQAVYPARGADRWIAISLFDRADYVRLGQLTGIAYRSRERAAFDRMLVAYTSQHDDFALMQLARGIAAGVVQGRRGPAVRCGPGGRAARVTLDHPVPGAFEHQSTLYRLSRTPAQPAPAPLLGQHAVSAAMC